MNANPATIVFILPNKIKKDLLSVFSIKSEPITAACDVPKDGRNVHKGADNIDATEIFLICFFVIFISLILVIDCSGISFLFIILIIRDDEPNNPVNNGNKEFLIGKIKVDKPKKPDRKNIIIAKNLDCFSFIIK